MPEFGTLVLYDKPDTPVTLEGLTGSGGGLETYGEAWAIVKEARLRGKHAEVLVVWSEDEGEGTQLCCYEPDMARDEGIEVSDATIEEGKQITNPTPGESKKSEQAAPG